MTTRQKISQDLFWIPNTDLNMVAVPDASPRVHFGAFHKKAPDRGKSGSPFAFPESVKCFEHGTVEKSRSEIRSAVPGLRFTRLLTKLPVSDISGPDHSCPFGFYPIQTISQRDNGS